MRKVIFSILLVLVIVLFGFLVAKHFFDKKDKEIYLMFTMSDASCDCDNMVELNVYSNNTYELYDTYCANINDDSCKVVPKIGNFTYDVSKILANNDKFEESYYPYLVITGDGKRNFVYDTNTNLKEFLKEINVDLNRQKTNVSKKIEVPETKNLLYSIKSSRVDCDTVTLELYDDKTYELYYYIPICPQVVGYNCVSTPKRGKFTYDISNVKKIIEKNYEFAVDDKGPFIFTDSDGYRYMVYETNTYFQELMKDLKIDLDKCKSY